MAGVKELEPRVSLEIKHLDEVTTPELVKVAMQKGVGDNCGKVKAFIMNANKLAVQVCFLNF